MIAVLITVFNRIDKTIRCLECLDHATRRSPNIEFRVFLVDDGSTDGTRELISLQYPAVTIVDGSGDLFWNRGMIKAWKAAVDCRDFDHYLWLNNDTFLMDDSIIQLMEESSKYDGKRILCAQTCSENTGQRTYGGWNKNSSPITYNDGWGKCEIINGNCVLIPRYVFERVGFLDETFRHSMGDHDYGLRAIKAGITNICSEYPLAYCESNERPFVWYRKEISLAKRICLFYSPLTNSYPLNYFKYERRHYGVLTAIKHFISNNFRLFRAD
jgi:GT2 family glycosyltransferase